VPDSVDTRANEADEAFEAFVGDHELRVQQCRGCGRRRLPPSWICPHCLAEEYEWIAASGAGVIHSFVWYLRPLDPAFLATPYNVTIVELAEGPRLISKVVGVEPGDLSVGQAVEAAFEDGPPGATTLVFRVRETAGGVAG
jgi:uncharacterized OB-fold protein